jgi:hypothetical protein
LTSTATFPTAETAIQVLLASPAILISPKAKTQTNQIINGG